MSAIDKIYNYFDREPDLKVLFIFNDEFLADELREVQWKEGYRFVDFQGDWFTVKYNLDNAWADDRVVLYFHQESPLQKKSLREKFLLLDAMAARRAILAIRCPAYEGLLDASNAMLAPADARRVAAAVLAHLRHPSLCAEHACAAAETLARDRSEAAAAEALRRCYALAFGRQGGEA